MDTSANFAASVIVSTYNQPGLLGRCLFALSLQKCAEFEIIVADDGSGEETHELIARFARGSGCQVKHVWQEDRGFRKTRILNKAILAADSDYLVFTDGDCVAHPDYLSEHLLRARPGHYLNGGIVRLEAALSDRITSDTIEAGDAFSARWLARNGSGFNRRYLRFSLGYRTRAALNRLSRTKLYWLGSNSSCFRSDALAVNGFDHRFDYGFEDGDFGNRLENYGLTPRTVRWTANTLHLWHERPWSDPERIERNKTLMAPREQGGRYRAVKGLDELDRIQSQPV